jgi:hypothetical protein
MPARGSVRIISPQAFHRTASIHGAAIDPWRRGRGYRVPGEFVVVAAAAPGDPDDTGRLIADARRPRPIVSIF